MVASIVITIVVAVLGGFAAFGAIALEIKYCPGSRYGPRNYGPAIYGYTFPLTMFS